MSTAPLRLVAAEPDWRQALGAAIRAEFRVGAYVADPDDPWLYGRTARLPVVSCRSGDR